MFGDEGQIQEVLSGPAQGVLRGWHEGGGEGERDLPGQKGDGDEVRSCSAQCPQEANPECPWSGPAGVPRPHSSPVRSLGTRRMALSAGAV